MCVCGGGGGGGGWKGPGDEALSKLFRLLPGKVFTPKKIKRGAHYFLLD